MPEDYGEPFYVQAHGGKNSVILYRSKANPNLAIEFFFRSSSKDGRSRYYRCTKCWYLYKIKRGTCATLIVRDGRIVTDPENPGVPHQCDFRPLETVAANRVNIAARKRKLINNHSSDTLNSANESSLIDGQSLKTQIRLEHVPEPDPVLSVFESFLSSASTSHSEMDSNTTTLMDNKESSNMFAQNTYRSPEFLSLINEAFADSMHKHNEDALDKLLQAVAMQQSFDTDDLSLLDNAFACEMNKASQLSDKLSICEQWLNTLNQLKPRESTRWIAHFQFTVYYCFHMIGLYSLRTPSFVDRKRFFDLAQSIFKGLLQCCDQINETVEELIACKLDMLLSLSFICTQYSEVSNQEAATFVQRELQRVEECVRGNYTAEMAALMVQKVYRIGENLDKHRNALLEITTAL